MEDIEYFQVIMRLAFDDCGCGLWCGWVWEKNRWAGTKEAP